MADLTVASVLKRRPDVRFRVVDGEAVVVRQEAGEVIVLNEIGARILALADGTAAIGHWMAPLLAEYETDETTLTGDVLAFAADLVAGGVLEESTSHGV